MIRARNKLLIFLLSFLSGVFLAPDFIYLQGIIYFFIFIFISLTFFLRKSYLQIFMIILLGLCLGLLFFSIVAENKASNIRNYEDGSSQTVSGFIASYPQEKEKSITFVLNENGHNIYISTPKLENFSYGQRIKVVGKINKIQNEDEFNFKDYFLSKNISYQMFYPSISRVEGVQGNFFMGRLFLVRKAFEDKTNNIFVKPYSSFVLGVLLGVKSLSNNLMDMFSKVSLSHIIVVSGYNLSIIAASLKRLFYPASRKLSFWIPFSGIWIFTLMVGADAPVARAAIMASIVVFSRKEGKKSDGVAVLTLAAIVMVIMNPYVLRFDPGFQLSFLSTLGILIYADRIEHWLSTIKLPKVIAEVASATLAAQIFILPVIAYYFGRVSILGPIANFIVLPVVPFIMFFSFITIILGFISLGIAQVFSYISVALILFCLKVGQFLADTKFSSAEISFNVFYIIVYFACIYIISLIFKNVKNKKP